MKGIITILVCCSILSCQLHDTEIKPIPYSGPTGNPNLLLNGSFEEWDEQGMPKFWQVADEYGYVHLASRSDLGAEGEHSLQLARECGGRHYVYQFADLEPGAYYEARVNLSGSIADYSYGGLVLEAPDSSVFGVHQVTYNTFPDFESILSVKFFSGKHSSVKVMLGFLNGMNAEVLFDNITLTRTSPLASFDPCVQMLARSLGVTDFSEQTFDKNVQQIIARLDYLLIDGYKRFLKTNDSSYLVQSKKIRQEAIARFDPCFGKTYFLESLRQPVTDVWIAYCQRSSLVASEILGEFNISTHEIYFVDDSTGYHQFIEYWNPYKQSWVIIDPFYGVAYLVNQKLVGKDELEQVVRRTGLMQGYVLHVPIDPFYYSFRDLASGWKGSVESQIYGDDRKTLP